MPEQIAGLAPESARFMGNPARIGSAIPAWRAWMIRRLFPFRIPRAGTTAATTTPIVARVR